MPRKKGPQTQAQLKKSLHELFQKWVGEFERMLVKCQSELNTDAAALGAKLGAFRKKVSERLQELAVAYGESALMAIGNCTLKVDISDSVTKSDGKSPNLADVASILATGQGGGDAPLKTKGSKKKKVRRKRTGGYSNMKPHVLAAVKSFAGQEFSSIDVQAALSEANIPFKAKWVAAALCHLNNVKAVGKKDSPQSNRRVNVYKVSDPAKLAFVDSCKKTKRPKGKKKSTSGANVHVPTPSTTPPVS